MNRLNLQTPLAPLPWPDPPTPDFLPRPRRGDDLLAHWEWWLYNNYLKAYEDQKEGIHRGWNQPWGEHLKGFATQLSTSAALHHICVAHCRDLKAAHDLIALLFILPDFSRSKKTRRTDRAPIEARALLRQLDKLDNTMESVSNYYTDDEEKAAVRKIFDQWRGRADRQSDPGPSAIVFNLNIEGREEEVQVFDPPAPAKAKRGRPKLSGKLANTDLSQVRALVRAAYRGRNGDQLTLKVIREFRPKLLQTESEMMGPGYAEKKLSARLQAFRATLAKEPTFMRTARQRTQQGFETTLRELCPPPDFVSASTSVADYPH